MAGGLARRGALPIVHSFACFLSARPNEQIYNQCSEGSKVIYVGSLAGLLPGGPGHSHQSVRDISALARGAEPGAGRAVRARPRCSRSSTTLVNAAPDSMYLRLVSVKWPVPFAYPRPAQGRSRDRAGSCATAATRVVFGYGPWLLANAWHAAEEVEQSTGASVRSGEPAVAQPRRSRVAARGHRRPPHDRHARQSLREGRAGRDARGRHRRARARARAAVLRVGVTALPECGTNDEVLAHHRLDVAEPREEHALRAGAAARSCA